MVITIPNDGTVKRIRNCYEWHQITSLRGISKFGSVLSLDNNNSLLVASPEEERIYEYELVCQNDNARIQSFGKRV
ncbi:hypothetical protein ABK040_005632 [Willaertia magna]